MKHLSISGEVGRRCKSSTIFCAHFTYFTMCATQISKALHSKN